jgi:hypothetical protein
LAPYLNAAWWIALSIHPYTSLVRVFLAGIPGAACEGDPDEDEEEYVIFSILFLDRSN